MKNVALLISLVFGVLHMIYLIFSLYEKLLSAQGSQEVIRVQTITLLIMPCLIIFILAVVFNALGFFLNHYTFTITAIVLYILTGIVYVGMIPYVCVETMFSLLALRNLKRCSILLT